MVRTVVVVRAVVVLKLLTGLFLSLAPGSRAWMEFLGAGATFGRLGAGATLGRLGDVVLEEEQRPGKAEEQEVEGGQAEQAGPASYIWPRM